MKVCEKMLYVVVASLLLECTLGMNMTFEGEFFFAPAIGERACENLLLIVFN
jgi:hypothetical protein